MQFASLNAEAYNNTQLFIQKQMQKKIGLHLWYSLEGLVVHDTDSISPYYYVWTMCWKANTHDLQLKENYT